MFSPCFANQSRTLGSPLVSNRPCTVNFGDVSRDQPPNLVVEGGMPLECLIPQMPTSLTAASTSRLVRWTDQSTRRTAKPAILSGTIQFDP
eukprot:686899-Hanusia_phi.AAC.10